MLLEFFGATGFSLYAYTRLKRRNQVRRRLRLRTIDTRRLPFPARSANAHAPDQRPPATSTGKHAQTRTNDRGMLLSLTSLGLAGPATLLYPPAKLLSLPPILYNTYLSGRQAMASLAKEKRLTVDALSAFLELMLVLNGYLFIAACSAFMVRLNAKLLHDVRAQARETITSNFRVGIEEAWILCGNGVETRVPLSAIAQGDIVVVTSGRIIPIDGRVIEGSGLVEEQVVTGCAEMRDTAAGDEVLAPSLLVSGKLYVQAQVTAIETTASRMTAVLAHTMTTGAKAQRWAEGINHSTVLPTVALGALSLPLLGPHGSLGIIDSHFKHRPSIASEIAVLNYLRVALERGILIKDSRVFELLHEVDTLVVDEAAVLIKEQPQVVGIHPCTGFAREHVLRLGAALGCNLDDPIAEVISHKAADEQIAPPAIEAASHEDERGLIFHTEGHLVHVGDLQFVTGAGLRIPPELETATARCDRCGASLVVVALDHEVAGAIEVSAPLRPGALELRDQLLARDRPLSVYALSGEPEKPRGQLAEVLGTDRPYAGLTAEEKAGLIAGLRQQGRCVGFIGDGLKDARAARQADLAVSVAGPPTAAVDAAQVILLDQTLTPVPYLFRIGQRFDRHMRTVFTVVLGSSALSAAGAVVAPGAGLILSFFIPQIGLFAGINRAMRPAVKGARPAQRG